MRTKFWFGVCAVLMPLAVWAADDSMAWLDKMQQALATRSFQGTLVIRQHNQMHTLRVMHGHDGGGWDNLESLDGESRRILRQAGRVITLFPERGLATISGERAVTPLHPALPQDREQLQQHYQVRLAGEGRVAQRVAQIVELLPRDQYRYGFRYWLERDSGLLLRCDLLDSQGQTLEQVMYSELSLLAETPHLTEPDLKKYRVIELDAGQQNAAPLRWRVRQLPAGFRLVQSSERPSAHGEGKVQQLVFSDGLTSVSVFVEERLPQDVAIKGETRMGVMNAFGKALNGHHVIVMGEVPLDTVRLMAQSIDSASEVPHD
jgi:sigma-E factor negative regulatory protein RseB